MAIKINEIRVKNRQNLIVIPHVGSFKFVENAPNKQPACLGCDLNHMGICSLIPCNTSERADCKDGIFVLLNK